MPNDIISPEAGIASSPSVGTLDWLKNRARFVFGQQKEALAQAIGVAKAIPQGIYSVAQSANKALGLDPYEWTGMPWSTNTSDLQVHDE